MKISYLIFAISSIGVVSPVIAKNLQTPLNASYNKWQHVIQKQHNAQHINKSNDDQISQSDQFKAQANEFMNKKDYINAKLYFHKAIDVLKDENGRCIDVNRVFALKTSCQKAQEQMNYADWGFKHSDDKYAHENVLPALMDQLHQISGYETITEEQLEEVFDEQEDRVMLNKDFYFSLWDRVFNDDGIDYAIEDHMGLYHATVFMPLEILAEMAHVLSVNIAIISNDTNEPIIIKQKNAIATLYLGYHVNLENIHKNSYFVFTNSAYLDEQAKPNKDIKELVANAPYSYEDDLFAN